MYWIPSLQCLTFGEKKCRKVTAGFERRKSHFYSMTRSLNWQNQSCSLESLKSSFLYQESHPRKSTVGASAIRFVKEKRTKEKLVSVPQGSSGEESGVELEETTNQPKKRASSWRFAAMFTKTQVNTKPDKGTLPFMMILMWQISHKTKALVAIVSIFRGFIGSSV